MNLGQHIPFSTIESGLRDLNPDITFDAAERRPSDYRYVMEGPAATEMRSQRCGVYYNGRYVTCVDRGLVPEFKVWSVREDWDEISMSDIERYDDTKVVFVVIPEDNPFYHDARARALAKDDNYAVTEEGRVIRYQALRYTKVRDRIMRVGWRHTFENLIRSNIPKITRGSLSQKFLVDMDKFPLGPPEEVRDALFAE